MDSAVQRRNMVDSQVRPSDVTDRRIARAMLDIPREIFVAPDRRAVAYIDTEVPVTGERERPGRAMLAPRTLAKMLQAMALEPGAIVLDVASATGYATAVLSRIVRQVIAVESDAGLAERSRATLKGLGIGNAEVITGPLAAGSEPQGPYDAILIGGGVSSVPASLLNQLKDGGRLIAVLEANGVGKVCEWRRFAMNFDHRALFDAEAPMLPGFERKAEFVL